MTRRALLFLSLCLAAAAPLGAALSPAQGVPADDEGLADASQPFSDRASHGVLWRQDRGLLGWRLASASAFGSQAAGPSPAKALLDLGFGVVVEGEASARFLQDPATVHRWPTWVQETATAGDLEAEAVTLYSATDAVVAAVAIKNIGPKPLRVRPLLRLRRDGEGLRASAELSARYPAVWLSLDRSALAGRRLVDQVGVWLGAQSWRAQASGVSLTPRLSEPISGGLDVELTWTVPQLLRPGQALRVPVLLAWGPDLPAVQALAVAQWAAAALPKGLAWKAAKARWMALRRALPPVDARWQRLQRRAALAVDQARYRARAALAADALSDAKGVDDAFSSVDTPLGALGLAETDMAGAEAAVLDLTSFSAAQPAPVPPMTGEEKLQWDAAGLPLAAWAGWELYHRDPDASRAGLFLRHLGEHLRNECAWWPPNRDGDGNGLYAFARDEEKPAYLRRSEPQPVSPGAVTLQTWSLPLTCLVTWQMQAASALADAAGDHATAQQCLAWAQHSQQALHDQGWDAATGAYPQGLDGDWPLLLGLEPDEQRSAQELDSLRASLARAPAPWVEQGLWEPWRVYGLARTLAAYGDLATSRALKAQCLDALAAAPVLTEALGASPSAQTADAVASAAVALEFLYDRQEQEVFLTQKTGEFEASWLQFRSLDGLFYMKRSKISSRPGPYAKIKVETPMHGPILAEQAFIVSCAEALTLQIQSERGLSITQLATHRRWFKGAHKVEWLLPARSRFLIKFEADAKQN
jgi:hypothetical protein